MRLNPKLFILLGLALVLGYFLQDLVLNDEQYVARIEKERHAKNDEFRRVQGSPLSAEQRQEIERLNYYTPNKTYRITAQFEPFPVRDTIAMRLTDGKDEKYLRWGRASSEWQKQQQRLTVFRKANGPDTTLFIPFTDKTNGFDTYGGGRYLDAPKPSPDNQEITLDFNTAYNPYCAYNNDYACPVPPADNRLKVAIKAGEKSFHE